MNTETGEIQRFTQEIPEELKKKFIAIEEELMTEKQKQAMQVSKYDNKSELGKLFAGNRAERRRRAKDLKRKLKKGVKK